MSNQDRMQCLPLRQVGLMFMLRYIVDFCSYPSQRILEQA